jgi:exopolysaccharide production protein ExoQ
MIRTSPAPRRLAKSATIVKAMAWARDDKYSAFATVLVWITLIRSVVPGFFNYSGSNDSVMQEGSFANQPVWLLLCIGALFLVGMRAKLTTQLLRFVNIFFIALIAVATASTLWSIDAASTSRRLFHIYVVIFVCTAACVVGWHPKRCQEILRPLITAMLAGSIVFGVIRPDLAITPPDFHLGETASFWHGLTTQKNQLGGLASFGAILWFHAWLERESKLIWILGGLMSSVACLMLSRSSTGVMATAFVMLLLLLLRGWPTGRSRYFMPYLVGLFVVVILTYSLALLKVVPGLDALLTNVASVAGKDTTFSARTQIWQFIGDHIRLSPIFGSGFGAFWTGPYPTSASYFFLQKMFFYPWESHNGYLDIVNDLGFVGLSCLLGYLAVYIKQSLSILRIDRAQAALYLALLFQQLVTNLTESNWLTPSFNFLVLTLATVGLARALLEQRFQASLGTPQAVAPERLSRARRGQPRRLRTIRN